MSNKQSLPFAGVAGMFAMAVIGGCGDFLADHYADDCRNKLTCPPEGGAAGEAGANGQGGTSGITSGGSSSQAGTVGTTTGTTGGTGSGGIGGGITGGTGGVGGGTGGGTSSAGGAGGMVPLPCDGACAGSTPVCDEETDSCVECVDSAEHCEAPTPACNPDSHECVECVENSDCDTGACEPETHICVECLEHEDCEAPTALCDSEQQFCVECLENTHCTDAQASFCDAGSCSPCQTNDHCAHLTGTTVCDASTAECVECTGTDYASCGELEGTPLVCDSVTRTCSDQKEQSAGLCNQCISDAECKPGQRCAREVYEETELGYRCFWERGADVGGAPLGCSQAPPYVTTRIDGTSIDGVTVDLCTLRISTCKAHEDFSNVDCEASEDVPDPSLCGEPDLNDAGCELFDTVGDDNIYLCTVRCSSDLDCRVDHECDTSADPPVCFLNP